MSFSNDSQSPQAGQFQPDSPGRITENFLSDAHFGHARKQWLALARPTVQWLRRQLGGLQPPPRGLQPGLELGGLLMRG